jgi:hypothetical protein
MYEGIARQGAVLVQPIGLGVRMLPQSMEKRSVFSSIISAPRVTAASGNSSAAPV